MPEKREYNFFQVLVDPRGFVRAAMAGKKGLGWFIIGLMGFVYLLSKSYVFGLGYKYSAKEIVLISLVFSMPIGYAILYVGSFFMYWVGKIFNGASTFISMKEAFLWPHAADFFLLFSWLGLAGIYGEMLFTPEVLVQNGIPLAVMGLLLMQLVFSVWGSIALFHTVGEVQGFSAWIAIWNVLFAWALMFVLNTAVNRIISEILLVRPVAVNILF